MSQAADAPISGRPHGRRADRRQRADAYRRLDSRLLDPLGVQRLPRRRFRRNASRALSLMSTARFVHSLLDLVALLPGEEKGRVLEFPRGGMAPPFAVADSSLTRQYSSASSLRRRGLARVGPTIGTPPTIATTRLRHVALFSGHGDFRCLGQPFHSTDARPTDGQAVCHGVRRLPAADRPYRHGAGRHGPVPRRCIQSVVDIADVCTKIARPAEVVTTMTVAAKA